MLGKRGELQDRITAVSDLFFWCLEKGVLVAAVGYAARATGDAYLQYFYQLCHYALLAGVYLRVRQSLFKDLDAAQKAAPTTAESLRLFSIWPVIATMAVFFQVQTVVGILATKAAH